jgi:hypothetical protein
MEGSAFETDVGFSLNQISHNLLGGPYLEHIQLGLREKHEKIFITPTP